MSKWQYLFLSLSGSSKLMTGTSGQLRFRINGEPLQVSRQMTIFDACNYFGDQGWEMVSHTVEGGEIVFIFKKQAE